MATQAQIAAVQQLYIGYLGRAADKAGLDFWTNAVATGVSTLESVATGFTLSNEYKAAFGGLTNDALVEKVYTSVLGRASDTAGKAFWVDALAKGTVTADKLVATFIGALSAPDQTIINNKTFVAQTYTDTVTGSNFSKAGAAAAIADVDGTPASVSTAITAITNGTLDGQVPGAAQINAYATAQASQTTFEAANKSAADALVTKVSAEAVAAGLNPADTLTDDLVANSSYLAKVDAVLNDAKLVRGDVSGFTTTILATDASDKAKTTTDAYKALSTTVANSAPVGTLSEKAQADAYVAAIAAEATAKTAAASDTDYAAVLAGLTADTTATTGLGGSTSAQVYSNYVNGNTAARAAIDTAFKDSAYYSTFKATVVKDAAYADAIKATAVARDVLDADTAANAAVVLHGSATTPVSVAIAADATVGSSAAQAYVTALTNKTVADTLLADAQKADVNVVAAQAAKDAYTVVTDAVADAKDAVDAINVAGKVAVHDLDVSVTGTAAVKDVFYFGTKVDGADDHVVAANNFGAGDSIVLGTGYTFNNGALTTGNNNALEFFLVKSDVGVNVVVEASNFGSSTVVADATTGAITTATGATDAAAVITLTGVTLDHVSVANGVVSYV